VPRKGSVQREPIVNGIEDIKEKGRPNGQRTPKKGKGVWVKSLSNQR